MSLNFSNFDPKITRDDQLLCLITGIVHAIFWQVYERYIPGFTNVWFGWVGIASYCLLLFSISYSSQFVRKHFRFFIYSIIAFITLHFGNLIYANNCSQDSFFPYIILITIINLYLQYLPALLIFSFLNLTVLLTFYFKLDDPLLNNMHVISTGFTMNLVTIITSKSKIETKQKLKDSTTRLEKLFHSFADPIAIINLETQKFIDVNNAAIKEYGYSSEEFMELSPYDLSAESDENKKGMMDIKDGKRKSVSVRHSKRKNGSIFPVEISFSPLTINNSPAIIAQFRDLSRMVKSKTHLERFRNMMDISRDGIFMLSRITGHIVDANKGACTMLGFTKDQLLQMDFMNFNPKLDIDNSQKWYTFIQRNGLNSQTPTVIYGTYKSNDGREFPVEQDLVIHKDHIMVVARDITERMQAEKIMRDNVKEKEVLLKEIHHRVKNNLQVISSLLMLQSNYVENEYAKNALIGCQNRILSMAAVHQKLYQSENMSEISLQSYPETLLKEVYTSYGVDQTQIKTRVEIDDLYCSIDKAIPIGLILNELVSNSLKYAFPEGQGEISIELKKMDETKCKMTVADNGIGLPKDYTIGSTNSLGLTLVESLAKQLQGVLQMEGSDGSKFIIEFPLKN